MGRGQGLDAVRGLARPRDDNGRQAHAHRPVADVGEDDRRVGLGAARRLVRELRQAAGGRRHPVPRVPDARVVRVERRARPVVLPAAQDVHGTVRVEGGPAEGREPAADGHGRL